MFCNKCGNQMLEGAKFCNICGAPAAAPAVPAAEASQPFEQQPEQQAFAPPPAYPPQPYPPQPYPPQQPYQQYQPPYAPQPYYAPPPVEDVPNTGLNVLSFFIPLVGFIMYATSHQQTPIKAKAMLKAAIAGMCVSVGIAILAGVLGVMIPLMMVNL